MPKKKSNRCAGKCWFCDAIGGLFNDIVIVAVAVIVINSLSTLVLNFFSLDGILEWAKCRRHYLHENLPHYLLWHPAHHLSAAHRRIPSLFRMLAEGRTPGKLMGIQVVSQNGQKLRLGQCLKRFVGYWISAGVLFLGYLSVLTDDDRLAWHDRLAKTSVSYDWAVGYNRSVVSNVKERQELRAKHQATQHDQIRENVLKKEP